jgi:glutamate-1-semialdehyde 2,1-aminomutase
VRDYRSAAPSADSLRKLAAFNTAALNEGLLIANYGLFALSTPMTNADAEFIIQAVEKSLTRMARQ